MCSPLLAVAISLIEDQVDLPADVTKQFALLRKDPPGWFEYVRLVPPAACRDVFSPEMPPEMLEATARALAAHAAPDNAAWCAGWLRGLSGVRRLEMTVLMLDRKTLDALRAMFDAVEAQAEALRREPERMAALDAEAVAALDGLPKLRECFGVA